MTVIHIVGAPGAGKTALRKRLANDLGRPDFGIDDERLPLLQPGRPWPKNDAVAWGALRGKLLTHPNAIVETSGRAADKDAALFAGVPVVRVRVTAPESIRRLRLETRSGPFTYPGYVSDLLATGALEDPPADHEWSGMHSLPGPDYVALRDTLRSA